MKKYLTILLVLTFSILISFSKAQTSDVDSLSQRFAKLYGSGDIIKADECLHVLLKNENNLSNYYKVFLYNNLGVTCTMLGRFDEALLFYGKAEKSITQNADSSIFLGDIYVNKAIIYGYQKSYQVAIDYFEKAIRIFSTKITTGIDILYNISTAYLNLGIIYYELGDYKNALKYLKNSSEIKLNSNLPDLGFVNLNIAKACVKLKMDEEAGIFFRKSINDLIDVFGNNYYRLAEVYFDYGSYLLSTGKEDEAVEIHKMALSICINNYGDKHSLVSYSFRLLGDDYVEKHDLILALEYYQKALIGINNNFNNPDIYSSPSIDSSLFDIRLLDNLKSKARALELLAGEVKDREMKLKNLTKSLETINLALKLIDRIRNNFLTEENRIYLAENEKDTYIFAIQVANTLFSLTGDEAMIREMYLIIMKAKAAVLRAEITENDLLWSAAVPDSLRKKQNRFAASIASYNNLILGESRKSEPDSSKITLWKDELFNMNRTAEKVMEEINTNFPLFHELLAKTEPVSLKNIQRRMKKNVTMIDYFLCSRFPDSRRKLYIFLITENKVRMVETDLDTHFEQNASLIRRATSPGGKKLIGFNRYTDALSYMYDNLIKPVESLIKGRKIIIIPDEEIAWLPFDAFLTVKPDTGNTDYEGLQYLINKYVVSYGYSSSMAVGRGDRLRRGEKVISFLPDYTGDIFPGRSFETLTGAKEEIGSVYKWFRGEKFTGENATKKNFMQAMQKPAIFHLAMHSVYDTVNSKYSYLQFFTGKDTSENGRLYNYEISLARVSSPLIVLSACNSGTGTLYHSEGLMSLARGFILAGASSLIKTSWEVNDQTSAVIIERFYFHLSKGMHTDEALRLAKLDYIRKSPPVYSDPYYWAAYELLGDTSPVIPYCNKLIIISLICFLAGGILAYYLRRRRIFSERPE